MDNWLNILLILTVMLPVAGALLVWLLGWSGRTDIRPLALAVSLVTLGLTGWIISCYPGGGKELAVSNFSWLGGPDSIVNIRFSLGLDGLGLWLFGLSSLLTLTAILVSWEAITERRTAFFGLLLLLETGMLGVFTARDIILFYIFFEFTLIPLFFLIGIWGSEDRRYAAVKFFVFTLAGSLLTFLSLLAIVLWNYTATGQMTFMIGELVAGLQQHPMDASLQLWVFLGLFAGFAIKVPLFPLHTWLPLAHTQAPTAGSVILAGILLKIGTYGFLRFSLPMLPDGTAVCTPWILWLSVIGIIYGALVALVQTDFKRLIAYSSVSHLGFCMLGIFALNSLGMEGGTLQMINHGLSTGGLFACVGMIYERYHTRQISEFGGLARRLPFLAFFTLVFTFSSIGLPGMNGFAGEFLLLAGMFQRGWSESPEQLGTQFMWIAVLAVSGVVLGAWYMLYMIQRIFFGPLKEPEVHLDHGHHDHGPASPAGTTAHGTSAHDSHAHDTHGHGAIATLPPGVPDLKLREFFALAPLVVFVFWIGLYPEFFLRSIRPNVVDLFPPAARDLYKNYGDPIKRPYVEPLDEAIANAGPAHSKEAAQ